MPGFWIRPALKEKCDAEFRGYLDGQDGSRYYHWLSLAVHFLRPNHILELGTNTGASAIAMYAELPEDSTLTTVDIQDVAHFIPEVMFADHRVGFVFGDDLKYEVLREMDKLFDLLFIDTNHNAAHLRQELEIYLPFCVPGALVVLDDINVNDMREVWDSLPYPKIDISQDCHYSGFGAFIYE